jgi:hypothetical protein
VESHMSCILCLALKATNTTLCWPGLHHTRPTGAWLGRTQPNTTCLRLAASLPACRAGKLVGMRIYAQNVIECSTYLQVLLCTTHEFG